MNHNTVICLMGPTASGKTDLACEWASCFPFEIISIDSAMIYRELDIGTAKPDASILASTPHHLIDCLDPPDIYSAAKCRDDVMSLCQEIVKRKRIPLLVGGTMMYFHALQQGLAVLPEADETIRNELVALANKHGWDYLHQQLMQIDKTAALRIHPHDKQRLQRALEVYHITGRPLSELMQKANPISLNFVNILLLPQDRAWLHQRIEYRFARMLSEGLVAEVESLIEKWPLTAASPSMRTVGYRQVYAYLNGEIDRLSMQDKATAATRQLAKRQLTWLRHWPDGHILMAEYVTNRCEMMAFIQQILDNAVYPDRPER